MVVGVLRLTLYIHGASSLKDKRQVLRKVTDRIRSRYNVSVAEVGENDIWQKAVVGFAAVANDHRFVNEVLDKVARDVEGIAEVIGRELEIETYSEMSQDWSTMAKPDLDLTPVREEPTPEEDEDGGAGSARDGAEPEAEPSGDEAWLREEDIK